MRPSFLLAAFAAGLFAAGCGGGRDAGRAGAGRGEAPLAVTVVKAGAGRDGGALILPARVESSEEVALKARAMARVTRFPVPDGASFKAGDPLAVFDAPEARASLLATESAHDAARSRRDLAARQEARLESLYADRVVSLHELESAQAERRAADAALAQAEASRAEWEAALRTPAPFDGVVVRHHVDEGAFLSPGDPLLDIRSSITALIVTAIPEGEIDRLGPSGSFEYQVGDGPWRPAALVRVEGMIDPATRSKKARFRPAARGERLEAGAYAHVRLAAAAGVPEPGAPASAGGAAEGGPVTVPGLAVVRRGALTGVYVVRDGRAALRWVRLGREVGDDVEVLAGLDLGESVIANPAGVEDGRAVEARP
ncbi:MAG TPA: efflux RND transporter periplasmic adaptor subunit [Candidatus Eisenbacteria bacterium]